MVVTFLVVVTFLAVVAVFRFSLQFLFRCCYNSLFAVVISSAVVLSSVFFCVAGSSAGFVSVVKFADEVSAGAELFSAALVFDEDKLS